ncbi:unnamed protein product [Ambrosiozyma monospora]|uniref:Unnamed protein product n=1 Tax=Ambrosiozyma monospora TaxID=43982 RepID=A0A9W6Z600_AMBMO|nr:unnamed protein product [Ambrosiozyma monospora]
MFLLKFCNDFFSYLNTAGNCAQYARPAYLVESNKINIHGINQQAVTNQSPTNIIAESKIHTLNSRIEADNNKENEIDNKRQEKIESLNLPEKQQYMLIDENDRYCVSTREESHHDPIQEHSHSHSRSHSHSSFAPPKTEKLQVFENPNRVRCLECHMYETKDGPKHLNNCSLNKKLDYQRPESHQSQETQQSQQSQKSQQSHQTQDSQLKFQMYQQTQQSELKPQIYQQKQQIRDTQQKQQSIPPTKLYSIRIPSLIRNRLNDTNVWTQ